MRTILIAGPAGAGKDTLARAMATRWPLIIAHLAQPLYDSLAGPPWPQALATAVRHGIPRAQAERHALQALGDVFRAIHPHALVDTLVAALPSNATAVVVPDVRLADEVAAFRALGETFLIYCDIDPALQRTRLTQRDGVALSPQAAEHPTEQSGALLRQWADVVYPVGEASDDTAQCLDAISAIITQFMGGAAPKAATTVTHPKTLSERELRRVEKALELINRTLPWFDGESPEHPWIDIWGGDGDLLLEVGDNLAYDVYGADLAKALITVVTAASLLVDEVTQIRMVREWASGE